MCWAMFMGLLVAPQLAFGGAQKKFEVQEVEDTWAFEVAWNDNGQSREVAFRIPRSALDDDRGEPTWFPRREFNEAVARDVRQWGKTVKRVEITAKVESGGVLVGASGPRDKAKTAMKEAEAVRDSSADRWLDAHDFFRMDSGDLSFDHANLVNAYAASLTPVAQALQSGTNGERDYVQRALSFVQAIPYEAIKRNGKDPGYRRPLALLYRNRGDCDSKAVLFLGLVEAIYPDVPLAVVYVPGHALVGVGLAEADGDQTFDFEGVTYLYAEPVGPAQNPLGQPAEANERAARKGQVRVVGKAGR